MSSFFNMFTKFTTRNLNEYNKIIDVIVSCETPSHHNTAKNMIEQFAKNCDHRIHMLWKNAWIGLLDLSFNGFREYNSYKMTTNVQIESVINHCNEWLTQYTQWEQEEKEQEEKQEQKKRAKIDIIGFSPLFKKKKSKRKSE